MKSEDEEDANIFHHIFSLDFTSFLLNHENHDQPMIIFSLEKYLGNQQTDIRLIISLTPCNFTYTYMDKR